MEEIHFGIFLATVFLPLLINAILDAFTGLLYRPFSDLGFILAIIGTFLLYMHGQITLVKVLTASGCTIVILCILQLIRFPLSKQGAGMYLGSGDYRLIMLTSYLCALKNPILSFFSLWLAGVFMLLIFAVLRLKDFFRIKTGNGKSRKESVISAQQKQANSSEEKQNLLYNTRKAPMGPAIISAAALTVFGSIAQT